jgi:hypothetical protein
LAANGDCPGPDDLKSNIQIGDWISSVRESSEGKKRVGTRVRVTRCGGGGGQKNQFEFMILA